MTPARLTEILSAADAAEAQVAEAVAYINGPEVGGKDGKLYCGEDDSHHDDNGNGPVALFVGPHEDDHADAVAWSNQHYNVSPDGLIALMELFADSTAIIPALVAIVRELAAEVEQKESLAELINRVCRDLPDDWQITIALERDSGVVKLTNPQGDDDDFDTGDGLFATNISDALDYAIAHERNYP